MKIRNRSFSLVAIALALAGCGDRGQLQNETDPAGAVATSSTANESVVAAIEGMDTAELREINDLPMPEDAAPFTIDQLVPQADRAVLQDTSDEIVTVKSRSEEGEDVIIVIERGDVAVAAINHWACAWVNEFAAASRANNEHGMGEAINQLKKINSLELIQEYDADIVDVYNLEIIQSLEQGDKEFASRWVQTNCAHLGSE